MRSPSDTPTRRTRRVILKPGQTLEEAGAWPGDVVWDENHKLVGSVSSTGDFVPGPKDNWS